MENCWEQLGEDTVLEFSEWMRRYFLDSTFLLSTSIQKHSITNYYNSLSIDKKNTTVIEGAFKETETFLKALEDVTMCLVYFMIVPKFVRNFPGIRWYSQRLKNQLNWMRNSVCNIAKARREEIEKTPEDQELTKDMLTMFLTINTSRDITERIADSLHDKPMTDDKTIINFVEIMAGGIGTSTQSICFLIHYLSNYPRVKEKLVEEFDRVLGKDPDYKITYEDMSKLEYCDAVINECARIFTIVPAIPRINSNPDELGGFKFPAKTQFILNIQGVHKHKSLWENPEEFIPERFMEKDDKSIKGFLYNFGGGLRKCPGRILAMMEIKFTLAMLYRKYDVELVNMNAPIKTYVTTFRVCKELKLRIKKRKI
ncbi:3955_t:CDS:2 [Acaulospora colombiana]|uniref:3955_t:CDS:1 n=1 Tax=Acaulospora colombiana TaxID=27376 RepID=A0ACA9KTY4_9GLOM|nr:3955_t:CDS:2 [Acaulospora colombiana]